MADTVRNLMELMVPELEDYERRGYFSRGESAAIVQRRQHFEYALKRRNTVKQDFLRCAPSALILKAMLDALPPSPTPSCQQL